MPCETSPALKKAVFLDRDGTVNVEKNYLVDPAQLELIPGAAEAIASLKAAGFLVVVVTNQSGVARGYFGPESVHRLHDALQERLASRGARIDAFYLCPHHPTSGKGEYLRDCDCRKGKPGMLLQAARDLDIDLRASFMVGDKLADLEAGLAAGCRALMVRTGYGAAEAHRVPAGTPVFDDLPEAARHILEESV